MLSNQKYQGLEEHKPATGQAGTLANEDGSIVLLALVVLILLTMVGSSATNTSTLEIQVAGNERNYKQNFFKAEAAALQASQYIENSSTYTETWMLDESFAHTESPSTKFDTAANWADLSSLGAEYNNTHALVIYTGVASWSSLDVNAASSVHTFSVYGKLENTAKNEKVIIQTGYAKRM